MKKTNWDMYYKKPSKGVKITRNITQNILLSIFKKHSKKFDIFCELGGANSCFYAGIRNAYQNTKYVVIDNNRIGLDLFIQNNTNEENNQVIEIDLLKDNTPYINADIVFSIGLIEHFSEKETPKIIKEHFRAANKDSIVIISFPTPTFLYRIVRKAAELLGIWRFPDERPLQVHKVINEVSKYGEIIESFINWKIILTQGFVVVHPVRNGLAVDTIKLGEV